MTEPKTYRKGRRTYTRVGAHKEVRIDGEKKAGAAPSVAEVKFDVGSDTEVPVYANAAAVHRSPDEVIVDLAFAAPNRTGARVRSRVAMNPRLAAKLGKLLLKASEEQ